MKRGKVIKCERVKLLSCELIKEVEKEGYIYLGKVEFDNIKENEMKQKTKKGYKQRLQLVLKLKVNDKKQNNSNKCIDSGCIQIRNRNTTVQEKQ